MLVLSDGARDLHIFLVLGLGVAVGSKLTSILTEGAGAKGAFDDGAADGRAGRRSLVEEEAVKGGLEGAPLSLVVDDDVVDGEDAWLGVVGIETRLVTER